MSADPPVTHGETRARSRLARLLVRARIGIVILWLGAALVATVALPSVEEAQTGALGDLVPTDAEAIDAEVRSAELFGFPLQSRTLLVQRDPAGLSPRAQARVLARGAQLARGELPRFRNVPGALPLTNTINTPPFTRELGTTAITFLFFNPEIGSLGRTGLAALLAERTASAPGDAFVGVTGAVPARRAQAEEIKRALPLVEVGTVLLVALVVALHFRSLLAPLATLLAVAVAYLVSVRVTAGAGQALEVSVPSEVEPVIVVLLFGIVTDYAIFFLSRMRRILRHAGDGRAAAERATAELLPTIVTAGLAVAVSSAALIVAEVGFLRAFGPGIALSVLVGLLVAITLLPALMAICGRAMFWPNPPHLEPGTADEQAMPPASPRAGLRLAVRRPLLVVAVCVAVLGAATSGVGHLEVGQTLIRGLPEDSEARVAYRAAAAGFVPGIVAPSVVVVERAGVAGARDELRRLQRRIANVPGVAAAFGPRQQPFSDELGAVFATNGNAARIAVILEDDPIGARAIATLARIRRELPEMLAAVGLPGARSALVGDTALAEETVSAVGEDLARVAPLATVAVALILALFLRSLLAPLYLVACSVIALSASLGLTVYVFQDLLGHGELTFYVPFTAAVLLLALGSDYNVFLTGRVWDRARVVPFRQAVLEGSAGAATAITVAGVVLAASFALLALVDLRPFRELAFFMTVGLLLDAFLVRTLLVPAVISLFGPKAAWPRRPGGA